MPKHSPNIVVVGSSNTDMVIKSSTLPRPGETVLGGQFVQAAGGKGANQAVAAARLGAHVTFVARVGDDMLGEKALAGFREDNIDISYIIRDKEAASGVALILVDDFRRFAQEIFDNRSVSRFRIPPVLIIHHRQTPMSP